jgi:hypothetical protein
VRPLARDVLALAGTQAGTLAGTLAETGGRARPKPGGRAPDGADLAAPEPGLAKADGLASLGEAGLYFEHFVFVGVMLLSALGALKLLVG